MNAKEFHEKTHKFSNIRFDENETFISKPEVFAFAESYHQERIRETLIEYDRYIMGDDDDAEKSVDLFIETIKEKA